jgi:phospholipase C
MGYYTRADLAFYYALADAFTVCDGYHCSVLGPTDPNRLYTVSATIDPTGLHGGPLIETLPSPTPKSYVGRFTWTTMPERLQAAGVPWKIYQSAAGEGPLSFVEGNTANNVLGYFKRLTDPLSPLYRNAFLPTFPGGLRLDVATGDLPAVSWVLNEQILSADEHPSAPSAYGEHAVAELLSILTSNPKLWAKTALFVTYDENGGFFDHVPPPTAPPGTLDEFVASAPGPIGLGFRVPMLVVSPFSRGGYVCSDTFDHTSILRFLETRFGVEVPNLSAWRRQTTGDLTTAFSFGAPADPSIPRLPRTSLLDPRVLRECSPADFGAPIGAPPPPYPLPPQAMPTQEPGTRRRPIR